ncbi:MAG TPA: alkaline phosphatase family protein [Gemmatimonadaceae bacterium]|nr:alkaline phosphatase family protein [Gemmatimonadaceae bacterium]
MTAPTRLLVLGIDAASPDLLDRWIADGTLPNLRALAGRGVVGRTRGIEGFHIGSTWPSLYTGTDPSHHGVHYLVQLVPGTYQLQRSASGEFVRGQPFWRALSDAGRRVAVLDVPLSRLDAGLNGIHVVEWGGHDSIYGFQCSPADLGADLVARFGTHPFGGTCDAIRRSADDYRTFLDRLEVGVHRKLAWTKDLLARGGWDLFMQVFTEAHCTGHQCWHLHEVAHPGHDPGIAAALGDPLRRIYRAIDAAVGELVEAAGDTVSTIVFSAHGMSHWYGAQFLLETILVRLGVTVPLPTAAPRSGGATAIARSAWRALPPSVRGKINEVRRRLAGVESPTGHSPVLGVDAARSLCFPLNNGLAVGGIRLNLVGREPEGRLSPGGEADAFVEQLTGDLVSLIDERTGRPLVRRVMRTADLYDGPMVGHLPDLLVEWSDEVPTGSTALNGGRGALVRAQSPRIGLVEGANEYARTGEHRPGGWFVAVVPGVAARALGREVSLTDLAPTFTRLLGVDLVGGQGRAIEELVAQPLDSRSA